MSDHSWVAAGFRRAIRLHRLVVAVCLVSVAAFLPAQLVVLMTAGPARANLPAGGLQADEGLVVFSELMRPVMFPLGVTLGFGWLMLVAWWVWWHAGTVRWWMIGDTTRARLSVLLGGGLGAWWRFARLALLGMITPVVAVAASWLPLLMFTDRQVTAPALLFGCVATLVVTPLAWLGIIRGSWLLGEPGRRSATAAWVRGLVAVLRQPLRSLAVLVAWALPGFALLALPLLYDGPLATLVLLVAWLASAFCWVALHLSFAPPKPRPTEKPPPPQPPGPYVTTRFPTLHQDT